MERNKIYKSKEIEQITERGYDVTLYTNNIFSFIYKGHPVMYFLQSQCFFGKTVKKGKGINNLLKQIPMRWVIINKEEIKKMFSPHGIEILKRVNDSLSNYFTKYGIIECFSVDICGIIGDYPTFSVNDVGNENKMINFYIISVNNGIYELKFICFQKC